MQPKPPADDAVHSAPLVDFLNTLPSPLTTTLVGLAPAIAKTRYTLQLLTWKTPWEDSWLFLAAWWAVCLVPEIGLRYVLPFAVFLLLFRLRADAKTQQPPPPATEDTLQRAIADLTAIYALLPTLPIISLPLLSQPSAIPPLSALLRSIAVLYIPYFALAHIIRLRILLALAGTLALTWRAHWAIVLRNALWRSAHLRWAAYRAWSLSSGTSLPPITLSPQSQSDAQLASASASTSDATKASGHGRTPALPSTSVRFLFTIYENQRWWMGLDWTAALLPGERPSWCSASQQPAAPPSAFALPAPTTAYTPTPDGTRRVKRVARWRWEEHEWRVVIRREGAGTSRVERPVPSAREESAAAASASRILKAAGKMRAGSVDLDKEKEGGKTEKEKEEESGEGMGSPDGHAANLAEKDEDEEPLSDPDGWVYADNKWEGASSKGGMGKYTRFRRWTRIAVLTETVEIVEPGELGIRRDEPASGVSGGVSGHARTASSTSASASAVPPPPPSQEGAKSAAPEARQGAHARSPSSGSVVGEGAQGEGHPPASEEEGSGSSRLRQRLKAAVMGASGHS